VTAATPSPQTWYVRQHGGTPYINGTQTPLGQCDGLHDADYGGTGTDQPCAVGNLSYLFYDQVTANHDQWMINGGDTVIVRQNPSGYQMGLTQLSPAWGGSATVPINCGNPDCYMPTIPSGTASQHTKILGENYASCTSTSAKTLLYGSWAERFIFNVRNSQFVDVACFELTDQSNCGYKGSFSPNCSNSTFNYGAYGVLETAMSSFDTFTDINCHGIGSECFFGAMGDVSFTLNRVRIQAPFTGIDTDDLPNGKDNISVTGGITMTNSITEFVGCTEEFPIAHNYPYFQCLDQNGGQGDGFGTANASGTYIFDHDIWRYNYQDGLDMLHSFPQSVTVTNSQSYGNIGNSMKFGSADFLTLQNILSISNCERVGYTIGDEPFTPNPSNYTLCRAGGGNFLLNMTSYGKLTFQNITAIGYAGTAINVGCGQGFDNCSTNPAAMQNVIVQGFACNSSTAGCNGSNMSAICSLNVTLQNDCDGTLSDFPTHQGWATRTNNIYNGINHCPLTLTGTETCNNSPTSSAPGFLYNQTTNTILPNLASQELMDPYTIPASYNGTYLIGTGAGYYPAAGSSLISAFGTPIAGLTLDSVGFTYANPPSIGLLQWQGAAPPSLNPRYLRGVFLRKGATTKAH
jgi:hypothetical protein